MSMGDTHGFTLIGLLVVVLIVAIFVGLLIPALHRHRRLATPSACFSNLKNIGLAMQMYATDYGDYLCYGNDSAHVDPSTGEVAMCRADDTSGACAVASNGMYDPYWYELLTVYTEGTQVFDCPRARHSFIGFGHGAQSRGTDSYVAEYTINALVGRANFNDIPFPGSTVFAWDCIDRHMSRAYVKNGDLSTTSPDGPKDSLGHNDVVAAKCWTPIHRGGSIFVFCDGHVGWYRAEVAGRDYHFASRERHWERTRGDMK